MERTISHKNSAQAAIDIGTSSVKCGIILNGRQKKFLVIGRWPNKSFSPASGRALNSFSHVAKTINKCLASLGEFCMENHVENLHIGICGHISSYLYWDTSADGPSEDKFPIWTDQSCEQVLPMIKDFFKDNNDLRYLGTFLPPATNWLLAKILYHHRGKSSDKGLILQISDAIFHYLTGGFSTHFSSAISIVHQQNRHYSDDILNFLGISTRNFPEISNAFSVIRDDIRKRYNLPVETRIFPAIADSYASMAALDLKENEGFVLSNSSEHTGRLFDSRQMRPKNFVVTYLNENNSILYGSTKTGGNIINWFFEKIYRKAVNSRNLEELCAKSSEISPSDCPVFIPYLEGERAPFWDNNLSGGFVDLKIHHDVSHLFRAVLTGIAFARLFGFESMPGDIPENIKIGGGGARIRFWNQIRADAMGKPHLVFKETELSILGTLFLMSQEMNDSDLIRYISEIQETELIIPDRRTSEIYKDQYSKFIKCKNL